MVNNNDYQQYLLQDNAYDLDFMAKFQQDIVESANNSFEAILTHYFTKIESTPYYFKNIKNLDQNTAPKDPFLQEFQ